jgi:hypothetical protein
LVSASVAWTLPDQRTKVKVWGTNLTKAIVFQNIGTVNGYIVAPPEPRRYGATVAYEF